MKNNPFTPSQLAQMKSFYQNELEQTQSKLRHIIDVLNKLDKQTAVDSSLLEVKKKSVKKEAVTKKAVAKEAAIQNVPAKRRGRPKKIVAAGSEVAVEKKVSAPKGKRGRPAKTTAKVMAKPAPKVATKIAVDKPKVKKVKVSKVKAKAKPTAKPKAKVVKGKRTPKKPIKVNVGGQKVKWTDFIVNALSTDKKPYVLADFTSKAIKALDISAADAERAKMAIAGTLTRMVKEAKQISTVKKSGQKAKFYVLKDWLKDGALKPEFAV